MEDLQEPQTYQLSYLLPPSKTDEEISRTRDILVKTLQEQGAEVSQNPDAMKRKLAYSIAKQTIAFAGKIVFSAQPHVLPALNASLRHEENLLRFVLTKKEKDVFSGRGEERFARNEDARRQRTSENYDSASEENRGAAPYTYQRTQGQEEASRKDHEKITIEDIDRKLDEIMKNIQ